MFEWLTPEIVAGILGLATVAMSGIFGLMRDKKILAEDQGDRIMKFANQEFAVIKAVFGDKPKYADKIKMADEVLKKMNKAWEDSKVRTPEFDEYFTELMKLVAEFA